MAQMTLSESYPHQYGHHILVNKRKSYESNIRGLNKKILYKILRIFSTLYSENYIHLLVYKNENNY